jgi:hypothetical protein
MTYDVREIVYRQAVGLEPGDLLTIKAAAQALQMTMPGVIAAINRGEMTEVLDRDARHPYHERRFVLREDVERVARRRGLEVAGAGEGRGDGQQ